MRHFGNQKFKIFFFLIENIFGRFFCSFQFSTNIVFQFAYLVMTVEYANMPNSRKNIFFCICKIMVGTFGATCNSNQISLFAYAVIAIFSFYNVQYAMQAKCVKRV